MSTRQFGARFGGSRISRRVRVGVGALFAALVVALVPLPPGTDRAQAAEQGSGTAAAEDSAMTLTGKKGPHDDFSGLKVTVHQTKNLRAQGVNVTWEGPEVPAASGYRNFLQIMQCWGDDTAGPDREQCEFGGNNGGTHWMSQRTLPKGLDPLEKEYADGGDDNPFVPFQPLQGDPTDSPADATYFSNNDTNAQPWLRTRTDGTGEAVFEVKSAIEAPYLGCGDVGSTAGAGKPRKCWLVVVPRGEHDPDGTVNAGDGVRTSPLSQSNWDQRLVFPMEFGAVGNTCPADKAERRVIGSELLTDAITSWQATLCAGADARFTYSQAAEDYARRLIGNPTATSPGMGITVAPIEEATDVVYAPVAVSALTVGFFWEDPRAGQVRDLKLSARLLAKLVTGSYPYDVRQIGFHTPVPDHLKGNAQSIVVDPEFMKLNPYFDRPTSPQLGPGGILLQAGNSDVNSLLWRYLQSNAEARDFLRGKPDPWGMKVNPFYQALGLDKDAPLDFPKADTTETVMTMRDAAGIDRSITYGQLEKSPYSNDMHDGALRVRRGATGATFIATLDQNLPQGIKLVTSDSNPGSRQAYSVVDAASASRYELDIASLPNADGVYVQPTVDSMLKAVARMPDSAVKGVKAPSPATAKSGAYPLTAVAYAMAPVDQPAAARQDYARLIRYAAGDGQTQGLAPGELPPGYAPLPKALRAQALSAADQLVRGKVAEPPATSSAGGGSAGGVSGGGSDGVGDGGGGGDAAGAGAGAAGAAGAGGATGGEGAGTPGTSASPGAGAGTSGPAAKSELASGGLTPGEVLGIVRWVLLGVLIVGGVAALAGPVLLRLSARRAATAAGGPG
ncbi:hypothetical protein ACIRQP_16345 [Streptomyces sp. NPDC102274]|uniref:hypothetical protein n=1 Tax=Streptomyces sp. NPDC102274 TaxID=3366151 RepID=UPI0037F80A9A